MMTPSKFLSYACPQTREAALADAFAAIEKAGSIDLARFEREKTDKRLNALDDYIAIWANAMPREGFAGGEDVFAQLMSARHWRNLRAKSLRIVRKQQLYGHRPSVRFWLTKAAQQRKTEKMYRDAERREVYSALIFGAVRDALQAAE